MQVLKSLERPYILLKDGLWEPNSIMVVYMDPLGPQESRAIPVFR